MNTKNNKRRITSQKKIEQAFVELLQTKEVKKISISEVCTKAKLNRSTFYANYLDIYDLVDKIRERMLEDFKNLYQDELENNYNSNDFLKLFVHIKENRIFYKTYFDLHFDQQYILQVYDVHLAKKYYNDQFIDYHCEFFQAGITAIIKKWISNDCDISPQQLFAILQSEYETK